MQSEQEDKDRMLGVLQNELTSVKGVCAEEHIPRIEELETENKKLLNKITELEESVDEAQMKASQAEKTKSRLALELEDTSVEMDRIKNDLGSMEKKQRKVDQMVSEWKGKCDQETAKNEGLVRELQKVSTDQMNLKNSNGELSEELENLKRVVKSLQTENSELAEQLEGGGKQTHEIEKIRRKIEAENEELRNLLEETEASLTTEENKTNKLALELNHVKGDLERRLLEKDEESDRDRKVLLRQIDALHEQQDEDTKVKNDLVKARKVAESEVVVAHEDLDSAEKAIETLNGNLGKQQKCINELQAVLEDSNKNGENLKQALLKSDKKSTQLASQKNDIESALEKAERIAKALDADKGELSTQVVALESQVLFIQLKNLFVLQFEYFKVFLNV